MNRLSGKLFRPLSFLCALLALSGVTVLDSVASPGARSLCPPVLNGVVMSLNLECINDTTALITNNTDSGWQYAEDGSNDGIDGDQNPRRPKIGSLSNYEIYGVAFREEADRICVAISGNMPRDGLGQSGLASYGDLFINLTPITEFPGLNFQEASNQRKLFAVNFTDGNLSNAAQIGVYKNVKAASRTNSLNFSFSNILFYEQSSVFVSSLSTPSYGALGSDAGRYFPISTEESVIEEGMFVGPIVQLSLAQLQAKGFDASRFNGEFTFGFEFPKAFMIDECGVVGGDGTSCIDCDGVLCGGKELDVCGVCGGDGSACAQSCIDTNGQPGVADTCGICNGDGKSCLDCEGTPFGGKKFDRCGECDGDGQSCIDDCVEQKATRIERNRSRRVKRRASTLVERTLRFADRATACDEVDREVMKMRALDTFQDIRNILGTQVTNTTLVCTQSICTKTRTRRMKRRLKRRANVLFRLAFNAKVNSINSCGVVEEADPKTAVRTSDFRDGLVNAIDRLPASVESCS